jgi:putative hydrolase of the HAD superfamily
MLDVIAFDADDTLWINEDYFRDAESECFLLLSEFGTHDEIQDLLYKKEIINLKLYGYGIKGFMLSMIETALDLSENRAANDVIKRILEVGKEMIHKPVVLLPGVQETLDALHGKFRFILATKGDLLDQERKLTKSGIEHYFHHIEIMSDKKERDYLKLMKHLDVRPDQFTMIGNSVKSDILPIIALGGNAIYVPYHTTWALEAAEMPVNNPRCHTVERMTDVLAFFE